MPNLKVLSTLYFPISPAVSGAFLLGLLLISTSEGYTDTMKGHKYHNVYYNYAKHL